MATLQDVRAFVKKQDSLSSDELEARVAKEFEMSRDEAAQLMRGLVSEDPSLEVGTPSLLGASLVAAGLNGTMQVGGTQNAAGVGALLVSEGDVEKEAANENIPSR